MTLKKLYKSVFIALLAVILPISANADSESFWNKLTGIAANNWMEVDLLTSQEIQQLTQLSDAGDPNAQYALGMIYQAKHDHDKAASWLKRAAKQGHVPARYSYNKNAAVHPDVASLNWQ